MQITISQLYDHPVCRKQAICVMECLERDSVSQSGHDSRKRRHILHQRGGNPYPHMDVERCQRFRRYGNRQGHTVIVGSRQRIQPVRNNTDSRQQHNSV